MYKVAINTRICYRGISGTATTVEAMVAALSAPSGEFEVERRNGPAPCRLPGKLGRLVRWLQTMAWDLWLCGRGPCDILIGPANVACLRPKAGANVLILHDVMAIDRSLEFDPGFRLTCRIVWPVSVWRADLIIVPSEWSKAEVLRRWPRASGKVVVIAHGVPPSGVGSQASSETNADSHLVLMLGSTEPHKNHVRGIEIVRLARYLSGVDFQVAIVGPAGRAEKDLRNWIQCCDPAARWIRRLGLLSSSDLEALFARCFALLSTSKAEGFGLPLLEAAASGIPVIHVRSGAMNEVIPLGEPRSNLGLAYDLVRLLDSAVYAEAVRLGFECAEQHTTAVYSEELQTVLRKCL